MPCYSLIHELELTRWTQKALQATTNQHTDIEHAFISSLTLHSSMQAYASIIRCLLSSGDITLLVPQGLKMHWCDLQRVSILGPFSIL